MKYKSDKIISRRNILNTSGIAVSDAAGVNAISGYSAGSLFSEALAVE